MREIDFRSPTTLAEALAILKEFGSEARCLAGGSDLIDQVRVGRRTASVVIDTKHIPELCRLEWVEGEGLHIGAALPCRDVYESDLVKSGYPILVDGTSLIGDVKIQNRAGIGGNLCNSAPSADTAPAVICLGGVAHIAGAGGTRQVPVEEFMTGPGKNVLAGDELLVEVVIPPPAPRSAGAYLRLIPRNEMDIAIAGVGTLVMLDGGVMIGDARITLCAVAPTPVRAREAEEFLKGKQLSEETIAQAGELASRSASPISDIRGSADYRRDMVKALTRKTLRKCQAALA